MSQRSFSHVLSYIMLVEVCYQYINLHYSYILIYLVINGNTRWEWLPLGVTGTRKAIARAVIVLSWLNLSRGIKKHSFAIEAVRRNVVFCTNTGNNSREIHTFPVNSSPICLLVLLCCPAPSSFHPSVAPVWRAFSQWQFCSPALKFYRKGNKAYNYYTDIFFVHVLIQAWYKHLFKLWEMPVAPLPKTSLPAANLGGVFGKRMLNTGLVL